ncbi:MAG: hypothetical protein JKX93_16685 [Rhizobiaceae bacterium]|nr:hypothetical protein [Rhizobiaceae bacterium]
MPLRIFMDRVVMPESNTQVESVVSAPELLALLSAPAVEDGRTIAHGLYLMSLIPVLQRQIYRISKRGRGLNYGYDRVRFVSSVAVESRIRLKQTLVDATPHKIGARLEIDVEIEIEGGEKPAMVARNILLIENL